LVRVPLGWAGNRDMYLDANPQQEPAIREFNARQTVEFRCPDGSADIYLLLAGLAVAARHGLEMENGLDYAKKTYVDVNIFHEKYKDRVAQLRQLPASCWESAENLEQQAQVYTRYNVFPQGLINSVVLKLKAYNDKTLRQEISNDKDAIMELVKTYFHCG
ncbi:MAG: glutamine synthetase, partial [Bacteroidota bacterium]